MKSTSNDQTTNNRITASHTSTNLAFKNNPYFLALDYGTQSVRALVFDAKGTLVAKAQSGVQAYRLGEKSSAEQDSQYCYNQLVGVIKQLFRDNKIEPEQLSGMTLTTQRACILLFDKERNPISPVYMWSDRRLAQGVLAKMSWYFRLMFKVTGLSRRIEFLRRAAKVNYLDEHQPKLIRVADKVGMLSGYLINRITAQLCDSKASQVGYLPFDYKGLDWAKPRSWRWQALACRRDQMLPLVDAGTNLGSLCPSFAADTGLPQQLEFVTAGADKACEVFATGCGDSGVMSVSLGSAAVVCIDTPEYREAYRYMPAFPSLNPSQYLCEIALERGFWLLSWFIEEFGQVEVEQAKKLGLTAEDYICRIIEDIPPGSEGLLLSPTWAQGVIFPGPEAKGAIVGFTPEHGRKHLYRACIEGILFNLKSAISRLETVAKTPTQVVRISGGGAQSDLIMQMAADIFNLPTERIHLYEASGLGAAMCCATGLGYYDSLDDARRNMVTSGVRFEPGLCASEYQNLCKVHSKLYPSIKSLLMQWV